MEEKVCQPVVPGRGCEELDLGPRGFDFFRVERESSLQKGQCDTPGANPPFLEEVLLFSFKRCFLMHTVVNNIPVLPSLQMWFFTF